MEKYLEEFLLKKFLIYKIKVDKKKIELKETIKELGARNVNIKLYEGVIANLKIDVVAQ